MWESVNPDARDAAPIAPAWPPGTGAQIETLNMDGGVIDNDPFYLAHDYLATLDPRSPDNTNPPGPKDADRAVVTVAPFPSQGTFTATPDFSKEAAVQAAAGELISVFIAQSRFFGESLQKIAARSFSRFVIAPSDTSLPAGTPALQGGTLGAFGGFFYRGFRAHDFELGRYNCQQFLKVHFALPVSNAIMAGISPGARAKFKVNAPPGVTEEEKQDWIPIIPLCTDTLTARLTPPVRRKMARKDVDVIVELIEKRVNEVLPRVLQLNSVLAHIVRGVAGLFQISGRDRVRDMLTKALGDGVEAW